jgi:SET domain-containing protein
LVIEYVGELVRNEVADKRESYYNKVGFGDCYMFRLDENYVVDASFKGNEARYLNHSCDVIFFNEA